MKIYVVRHWQDRDNKKWILNWHRNSSLTFKWKKQAKKLAKLIKDKWLVFKKIYSSPLKRANKTAKIISKIINWPKVEIMNDLIERDFWELSWKPYSMIKKLCKNIIETKDIVFFLDPKNWETFPQTLKRAKNVLNFLNKTYSDNDNVLLVCHWDIAKMLYSAYYDIERKDALDNFYLTNTDMIILEKWRNPQNVYVFDM